MQARTQRRRSAVLPFLIIIAALVVAIAIYTSIWTDRLWFESIGFSGVFTKLLLVRAGLFVSFGLIMAAVVAANVAIAHRVRPGSRAAANTSPMLERYRMMLESRFTIVMVVLAVIAGLFAGGVSTGQAQTYLAWQNSTPFGTKDPKFGIDVSFFVFDYPWWRYILSFIFTTLVLSAMAAAIVHYVMGAIRVNAPRRGGTPAAQAHLSILVGLAVLVRGAQYWMDRYGLQLDDGPRFTGLRYTTDHATLNAHTILAVIAVIIAALFFVNAVLRRWVVPTIGLVLLVLSSIILGLLYPAIVQGTTAGPNEGDKERPYIQRNIDATRAAYDVSDVKTTTYNAKTTATAGQLRQDASVLPSIRLMDPARIGQAFEQLQQVKGYYQFPPELDVDRYQLGKDKATTDAVVSVRELNMAGIQDRNWNIDHTVYTHGYGMVAANGSKAGPNGEPDWLERDLPPTGELGEHESRIYFGEMQDTYSIVGAKPNGNSLELDTPTGGKDNGPKYNTYDGKGGVQLNGWRRLIYALKYFDANLVLSNRTKGDTKIIYDRDPKQRVEAVAPWLTVDRDAYPAVVDGRVVWIVDGYTTADTYPNSQRVSLQDATSDTRSRVGTIGAQPDTMINYMRNSVKAVVDAYDGSVKLYAWDENDPVLKTWEKAFPGTVQPKSDISADLTKHLRYPQDMYKVQRQILGKYHVSDAADWFTGTDQWTVPSDPSAAGGEDTKEPPYYLTVRMPGQESGSFSLTSVYVPNGRQNMAAYSAVNSDPTSPNYGKWELLRVPAESQIDGPGQASNAIRANDTVATALRPFTQGTASVTWGNLLTLPLGGGLMYVQPIYTQQQGSGGGQYPILRYVVVKFGQNVGIGATLQDALDQVFKGDAGASTGEESTGTSGASTGKPGGPADEATAREQLDIATAAFKAADEALKGGNLSEYQDQNQKAQDAVQAAIKALGGG
ncbi:UPF0182 family membrane protein [Microlunatus soli]|uniref:UPF0182 protein SAMN04489812_0188 n=1 Tax=Microlunatus soli TaxID=630515 RepID=A0A1H1MLK6_9ACTN|nr:UPF0182 family protein [Microlunatus soli]SDR87724.1 hypothetical protein SAMN04489812_0188 [Microlunatus soli]